MYSVKYSYKHDSPVGGNTPWNNWHTEIKLYDAETAEELQKHIDAFLSNDCCGYRKAIKVIEITKL